MVASQWCRCRRTTPHVPEGSTGLASNPMRARIEAFNQPAAAASRCTRPGASTRLRAIAPVRCWPGSSRLGTPTRCRYSGRIANAGPLRGSSASRPCPSMQPSTTSPSNRASGSTLDRERQKLTLAFITRKSKSLVRSHSLVHPPDYRYCRARVAGREYSMTAWLLVAALLLMPAAAWAQEARYDDPVSTRTVKTADTEFRCTYYQDLMVREVGTEVAGRIRTGR